MGWCGERGRGNADIKVRVGAAVVGCDNVKSGAVTVGGSMWDDDSLGGR